MCIRIKAKKIVQNGDLWFEIVSFKALGKKGLPSEYTVKTPAAWLSASLRKIILFHRGQIKTGDDGKANRWNHTTTLAVGHKLTKAAFEERMAFLDKCGERLTEINAAEKKAKTANWSGEVDIEI